MRVRAPVSKLYLVAGEASGDLHAAGLVRALARLRPDWRCVGLGGDRMAAAGVELRANLVERSVMGVRKVLAEFGKLFDLTAHVLQEFEQAPPRALVLVDYPGLNLNLARMARARGIPVVYYICPQVWAWAPWRLRRVARRADLLLPILPFEESIYRAVHPRVRYVGNPVFDHLARLDTELPEPSGPGCPDVLAIFPGSRRQEVEESLPVQLRVAAAVLADDPPGEVVVSCHRPRLREVIQARIDGSGVAARIHDGPTHRLQRQARLALVVSGTATLEQAYFGAPMVVLYATRRWERALFGVLSVTPFIALVNLFAGRRVVPEFLVVPGKEEAAVVEAARALWPDGPARLQVCADLAELRAQAFGPGASERAAEEIRTFLEDVWRA